jgi:hypothetical protein
MTTIEEAVNAILPVGKDRREASTLGATLAGFAFTFGGLAKPPCTSSMSWT